MQQIKRIKNPRKQRKIHFNAPAHLRHKRMGAPLSPELAASRGVKTLPVRKGDTVRIQRGDHKGFEGKVSRVDLKEYRIYLEGLTREKVDGTNIFLPIHPSKVEIRSLNLDDNWRKNIILPRKKEIEKPKEEEPRVKQAKIVAQKAPAKKKAEAEKERAKEAHLEEEKAAPEVPKEEVLTKSAEKTAAPKKAAAKAKAKKTAAKKAAPAKKEEPSAEEKTSDVKKAVKPKATTKKAPVAQEKATGEVAPKRRTKRKVSEKTEGGS
jgi:large subunit ribosomal protein L24